MQFPFVGAYESEARFIEHRSMSVHLSFYSIMGWEMACDREKSVSLQPIKK